MLEIVRRVALLSLFLFLAVGAAALPMAGEPADADASGTAVLEIETDDPAAAEALVEELVGPEAAEALEEEIEAEDTEMAEAAAKLDKATTAYADKLMAAPPEGMTKGDVAMVFGNLYALGILESSDGDKAKEYLESALANGVPEAGVALGALALDITADGENGPGKDLPKAMAYYEDAAKAGSPDAMRVLGRFYTDGENGVEKDAAKGTRYFLDAARYGDEYSLNRLTDRFAEAAAFEKANPGKKADFPTSREAAVDPALFAKKQRWEERTSANIGTVYSGLEKVLYEAVGLDYDMVQARKEQEKQFAALVHKITGEVVESQPDAKSKGETAFALGGFHAMGVMGDVDLTQAEKYYTLAAENGVPEGLAAIGEIYGGGVPLPEFIAKQDVNKALDYFQKAAALGVARANTAMGALYQNGRQGMQPDRVKAAENFRIAAESGDPDALAALTELVADTPQSERAALKLPEKLDTLVNPEKAKKNQARLAEIEAAASKAEEQIQNRLREELGKMESALEAEFGAEAQAEAGAETEAQAGPEAKKP